MLSEIIIIGKGRYVKRFLRKIKSIRVDYGHCYANGQNLDCEKYRHSPLTEWRLRSSLILYSGCHKNTMA